LVGWGTPIDAVNAVTRACTAAVKQGQYNRHYATRMRGPDRMFKAGLCAPSKLVLGAGTLKHMPFPGTLLTSPPGSPLSCCMLLLQLGTSKLHIL